MKISVKFERKDILPAVLWASCIIVFYLLLTSATGSIEEFEPKAAAVWFVATALWCVPPAVIIIKRIRRKDSNE